MIDDRAVSTTLNYVLSLAIATLLVTSLLVAGSGFVSNGQQEVIRNELSVIGEQVASDVERVDRLVVAGEAVDTANVTQEFPGRVSGTTYHVSLTPGPEKSLELTSVRPNVTVSLVVSTQTDLGDSRAGGGPVRVSYDDGADQVVIGNG
jgi:hypothetical protein